MKASLTYFEDFYEKSKFLINMEFAVEEIWQNSLKLRHNSCLEDFIIRWASVNIWVCYIHKMKIIHRDLKPANISYPLKKAKS